MCGAVLGPEETARLKDRVSALLYPAEDTLVTYPLCSACAARIEALEEGKATQYLDFIVI